MIHNLHQGCSLWISTDKYEKLKIDLDFIFEMGIDDLLDITISEESYFFFLSDFRRAFHYLQQYISYDNYNTILFSFKKHGKQ